MKHTQAFTDIEQSLPERITPTFEDLQPDIRIQNESAKDSSDIILSALPSIKIVQCPSQEANQVKWSTELQSEEKYSIHQYRENSFDDKSKSCVSTKDSLSCSQSVEHLAKRIRNNCSGRNIDREAKDNFGQNPLQANTLALNAESKSIPTISLFNRSLAMNEKKKRNWWRSRRRQTDRIQSAPKLQYPLGDSDEEMARTEQERFQRGEKQLRFMRPLQYIPPANTLALLYGDQCSISHPVPDHGFTRSTQSAIITEQSRQCSPKVSRPNPISLDTKQDNYRVMPKLSALNSLNPSRRLHFMFTPAKKSYSGNVSGPY